MSDETQNRTHTPGPWETAGRSVLTVAALPWAEGRPGATRTRLVARAMSDFDSETAGDMGNVDNCPDDWEAMANARLMAAAPAMLEALESAERQLALLVEFLDVGDCPRPEESEHEQARGWLWDVRAILKGVRDEH